MEQSDYTIPTRGDTAVGLREFIEKATLRVVLAGYSFIRRRDVLEPLYRAMVGRQVDVRCFVVPQPERGEFGGEPYGQRRLAEFACEKWSFDRAPQRILNLYWDRRSLNGERFTSLAL